MWIFIGLKDFRIGNLKTSPSSHRSIQLDRGSQNNLPASCAQEMALSVFCFGILNT